MLEFDIGSHQLKNHGRCFIIAEIAQAHDGSLGAAHAYIDAVADAGADAIKFQTHYADEESTYDEPFRVKFSSQDASRYDYWKRMEFSVDQWRELALHAQQRSLVFLSSAFSVKAVQVLDEIGVPAWKVGSGEFWSLDLLEAMIRTEKPLLVSTGMSSDEDIDNIACRLTSNATPFALFQCTSQYPAPLRETGLNILDQLIEKYKCPVGLSDHSGTPYPALAAMARGCALIEVHLTFDKRCFGPDVSSSLDFCQLELLTAARTAFYEMLSNPVSKNANAEKLLETKSLFSKSLALRSDMLAGCTIKSEDLIAKKPGTGLSPDQAKNLIGRTLTRDVTSKKLLSWDDIL
jgi:N,N'-diacetyllegionaminate synthase